MTNFVFITANDIHISDNPPRARRDDFRASILNKLSQMGAACNKLDADAAIIAGDLYNLKNPARNSHRLNQELIKVFKSFRCPIYMIEGNHDLTANNLDSIENQPLGVLFADGTLIKLREEILQKDGHKILLFGVPYKDDIDIDKIRVPELSGVNSSICVLHLNAAPVQGILFKERIYGYKELAQIGADVYVLGHYHIDQGIEKIDGKHFINIGCMGRGVLAEETLNHEPQIGFIKISIEGTKKEISTQSIKLKVKPASEIFDLKKREEEQKESEEIKLFVEKLATESLVGDQQKEIDLNETVDKMDVAKEVKNLVLHFLHEASK